MVRLGCYRILILAVACGRCDVYYEGIDAQQGLKPWDSGAGSLILLEAGGSLSDLDGSPFKIDNGRILAASTLKLSKEIASCIGTLL
jgi:myo-inositol-1(or 4)-monophosphatase